MRRGVCDVEITFERGDVRTCCISSLEVGELEEAMMKGRTESFTDLISNCTICVDFKNVMLIVIGKPKTKTVLGGE